MELKEQNEADLQTVWQLQAGGDYAEPTVWMQPNDAPSTISDQTWEDERVEDLLASESHEQGRPLSVVSSRPAFFLSDKLRLVQQFCRGIVCLFGHTGPGFESSDMMAIRSCSPIPLTSDNNTSEKFRQRNFVRHFVVVSFSGQNLPRLADHVLQSKWSSPTAIGYAEQAPNWDKLMVHLFL